VVTAESCTAGLIAAVLSHARNVGDCLHGGFVVYTKENKTMALDVDSRLLATRGAVNEEVAIQMARGALERSPADIALAVTGVLGRDPDEDRNPAGLVCFALCRDARAPVVARILFTGLKPDDVRRAAAVHALELLQRNAL